MFWILCDIEIPENAGGQFPIHFSIVGELEADLIVMICDDCADEVDSNDAFHESATMIANARIARLNNPNLTYTPKK